jgi:translocation and assembly module TamB
VLGTILLFVFATVAGIAIHLDHPAARRLVSRTVTSALEPVLNGTIVLEKVDRIALLTGRVAGMNVTVRDPEGHTVIVARWVSARIALLPLIRSLVDDGPLRVHLDRVRIEGVDVTLRDDASGEISLESTFLPRVSSEPGEPREQGLPSEGVVLTIEDLSIGHAWAHGSVEAQPVDIEVDGLSGRLRVDPDGLAGTLRHLAFRLRELPLPAGAATGSVEGVITLPFAEDLQTAARASVRVRAGDLSATVWATLHGEAIEARVEVPTSPPRALSALVEGVPLLAPFSATMDVSGNLQEASLKGRIDVGEGHVEIAASAEKGDGIAVGLEARIAGLSLSESFEGMPAGIIDAEVRAAVIIDGAGVIRAEYDVSTSPTTVAGHDVPWISTRGSFDGKRLRGEAGIDEPGAPTIVHYALAHEREGSSTLGLDVDIRTEIPDLRLAPRLDAAVGGAGRARVRGHITLDDNLALDAVASASVTGLTTGPVTVERTRLEAIVRGTARSPTVQAVLHANDLRWEGLSVNQTTVRVDGGVLAPRVRVAARTHDGDTFVASANVVLGRSTSLRGVEARLVRNSEEVKLSVRSVRVSERGTAFQGVRLEGAGGSLEGNLSADRGALRVESSSTPFDLSRVRALVGPSLPELTGTATVHVDLVSTREDTSGFLRIAARAVGAGAHVQGGQIDGEVIFEGRDVALRAAASVPEVGALIVTSAGARLGGGLLATSSYRTATGGLDGMVVADLARVAELFPTGRFPLAHIAGNALFTVRARRSEGGIPDVSAGLTTAGLELTTKPVDGGAGKSLRGVDLALSGGRDPGTGWATLDVFAKDEHGVLVEVHVGSKPSGGALLDGPDAWLEELLRAPFELDASVPLRDLEHLPGSVQLARFRGMAAVNVLASGTVRDPRATVTLRASNITLDGQGSRNEPVDVRMDAEFEDGRGSATAEASSEGRVFLVARSEGTLQVSDLLDGRAEGIRWSAGGDLALSALPLRSLPMLAGERIGGCVSGTVSLRGLHEDAKLEADVDFGGLRVGRTRIQTARVKVRGGEGKATLDARIEQGGGELTARGSMGIVWGAALTPSVDDTQEASGRVRAKAFGLAPLHPLLFDSLGKIDGVLDADLRIRGRPSGRFLSQFEGEASVRDGVVDVALLGQEFRAIQGKLTISPEGELRLRDASAEGIVGRVVVEATAHLDGFALKDAKATVRIARDEAMSLTYEGVEIGNGWGDVDIKVAGDPKGVTTVDIVLPRFHLELPNEVARSSQKLDDEPTIQVGTYIDEDFVSVEAPPESSTEPSTKPSTEPSGDGAVEPEVAGGVVVRVVLGQQVRVHHTNAIEAWLSGRLEARLQGSRTAVSGAVRVERGFVELRGRRFDIEHATASFDPTRPPADPTVRATAVYDAPDGTRVFADYTGTAETGTLRLHSDPALEQSEILSLIAFGTREREDGSQGSSAAGAAGTAASAGGGVAAQGLNKIFSNITPVEITTRVDTSDSQDPRPEVAVAITDKVSASVGYRLGLPVPGQPSDRSTLRIEYRFRPRWLLETSVGDKGTSIVDLIWKLRY